eukprot:864609-Rhodomonas_salina.1
MPRHTLKAAVFPTLELTASRLGERVHMRQGKFTSLCARETRQVSGGDACLEKARARRVQGRGAWLTYEKRCSAIL